MKLVLLGFAIVGIIGFVVYFVAAEIELVNGVSNPAGTSTPAILFRALLGV